LLSAPQLPGTTLGVRPNWPVVSSPKLTTVPDSSWIKLCWRPAAINVTPVTERPNGALKTGAPTAA
jgi:hypothetical protein